MVMRFDKTRALTDRRAGHRHAVRVDVNYRHDETYLFSRTRDVSELGIFLVSKEVLPRGTRIDLEFRPPGVGDSIKLEGEVVWLEPGGFDKEPGMGVRFINPSKEIREQMRTLIRTVAYLE